MTAIRIMLAIKIPDNKTKNLPRTITISIMMILGLIITTNYSKIKESIRLIIQIKKFTSINRINQVLGKWSL